MDVVLSIAEDLERVAEVESVEFGVQGEEDLDDLVRTFGIFCNRTHLAGY